MDCKINLYLPKVIEQEMRDESEKTGISLSEIVRDSLRKRYKIKK